MSDVHTDATNRFETDEVDSVEELSEVRNDSGIDYEGDEEAPSVEDEDELKHDETPVVQALTSKEIEKKKQLLLEEEKMFEQQKQKQKETLAAAAAAQEEEDSGLSVDTSLSSVKDKRMNFLMGQSEIFTSFLMGGTSTVGKTMLKNKKKNHVECSSPNRRGRKKPEVSAEDDAAMLEMEESRFVRLDKQPGNICFGTMRPFQLEGLNWMIRLHDCGVNGILADEMGLGKTLQTISLLAYLREARGVDGPHIIIVPKSTVGNWMKELGRWCPSIRAFRFMGSKDERALIREKYKSTSTWDVCVCSFEIAIIEKAWLRKIKWKYLIIDEAHRIKNENSKLSQVVREYSVEHRLLITGTPLQNNLHELWALLNFLLPDIFTQSEEFDSWFNVEDTDGQSNVIKKLHTILRPFLLRRLKVDVATGLPPKTETKLFVGLSEMQRAWYMRVLQKDAFHLNAMGGSDGVRLLNILMQLRKVCNHPYLFDGAEPQPFAEGPHLWDNCGKLTLLHKLLPKLKQQGSRVLLFCQMTKVLDIMEDYMRYWNHDYCRIDGNTKGEDRDSQMDEFNAPESSKFCFLLSTRAGGLGINLATADIVILYDSDWNPQVDLQAMDRAHRIGQKKPVRVFRFISDGTVEEKIIERAERKLYLDAAVIQQGRLAEKNRKLSKDELMTMVRFGADEIFQAKGSTITDEDIDAILAKGEERTEAMKSKIVQDVQHNLANFSLTGDEATLYQFEGENFGKDESDPQNQLPVMPATFIALPQRERRKNYDVDDYYRSQSGLGIKKKSTGPREPRVMKVPTLYDFQFYQESKMLVLLEKKLQIDIKRKDQVKAIKDAKKNEDQMDKDLDQSSNNNNKEEEAEADPSKKTDAPKQSKVLEQELEEMTLSRKDQKELESLEAEGFGDFKRQDFKYFIASCERFGRDQESAICDEVAMLTGKTAARIRQYYHVFWKRHSELKESQRYIDRIERGEKRIQRNQAVTQALAEKCAQYTNPWLEMTLNYSPGSKGHGYTSEEDVFIVCLMNKYGIQDSVWIEIKDEIRKAWQFRFDWFIKSRNVAELQKRGEYLTKVVEREMAEIKAAEAAEEKSIRAKITSSVKKKGAAKKRNSTPGTASAKKRKTK